MIDEKPTADYRAGYEEGRLDAIPVALWSGFPRPIRVGGNTTSHLGLL